MKLKTTRMAVVALSMIAAGAQMSTTVVAGGSFISGVSEESGYDWAAHALYESCMNGDVWSTGEFRSQIAKDKAVARMMLMQDVRP